MHKHKDPFFFSWNSTGAAILGWVDWMKPRARFLSMNAHSSLSSVEDMQYFFGFSIQPMSISITQSMGLLEGGGSLSEPSSLNTLIKSLYSQGMLCSGSPFPAAAVSSGIPPPPPCSHLVWLLPTGILGSPPSSSLEGSTTSAR